MLREEGSVAQGRLDVIRNQKGIGGEDVVPGVTRSHRLHDHVDRADESP